MSSTYFILATVLTFDRNEFIFWRPFLGSLRAFWVYMVVKCGSCISTMTVTSWNESCRTPPVHFPDISGRIWKCLALFVHSWQKNSFTLNLYQKNWESFWINICCQSAPEAVDRLAHVQKEMPTTQTRTWHELKHVYIGTTTTFDLCTQCHVLVLVSLGVTLGKWPQQSQNAIPGRIWTYQSVEVRSCFGFVCVSYCSTWRHTPWQFRI